MRLALLLLVAVGSVAEADDGDKPRDLGVLVQPAIVFPNGGVARTYGGGVEAALLPYTALRVDDCPSGCIVTPDTGSTYLGAALFATATDAESGKIARQVYGLQISYGYGWHVTSWLIPYATIGLDPMVVSSRLLAGDRHTGMTLGASLRAGLLGYLGRHVVYSVTASLVGAIAPGVGDNAGGLVLQAAIGWRFHRDHWEER
jgi:hypothetical protein